METHGWTCRIGSRLLVVPVLLALALALVLVAGGAALAADDGEGRTPEYQTIAELAGKRVGMGAGNVFDQLITQYAEGIDSFSYYATFSDLVAALKSGKIDAIIADEPAARLIVARNDGIAVTDLTRAGDLIRSRTMEAFFPLFSIALIYFVLCCVVAELMGLLIRRLDLSRRPRTIKGVEL